MAVGLVTEVVANAAMVVEDVEQMVVDVVPHFVHLAVVVRAADALDTVIDSHWPLDSHLLI